MATKKPSKTNSKTRVSKGAKKKGFQFRWWMALILVVIVGGVGVLVYRASFAGLPCSQAQEGQICDAGPIRLKILANVNSGQCVWTHQGNSILRPNRPHNELGFTSYLGQAQYPGDYRCGEFNNGQFKSPFVPTYPNDQNSQMIYKMYNNFNTTCGRISRNNPFDYFKNRTNPNYMSPENIFAGSTYSDQNVWWTSVGCPATLR